jgi:hypothetical protein
MEDVAASEESPARFRAGRIGEVGGSEEYGIRTEAFLKSLLPKKIS